MATGCGSSDDAARDPAADPAADPADTATGKAPPKAAPVGGPASVNELTDALGVFVAPSGKTGAEGTHSRPLATIQAGIELAKRVGKRVYVCAGTFHEALTLADSISIIGALDCTAGEWRPGALHTRVESPSSPAITAANITSATRVEGLEIVAPHATQPSGSSIGLLATKASALVIANTKISGGNGMKGDDGTDGIQLANSPTSNGAPASTAAACAYPLDLPVRVRTRMVSTDPGRSRHEHLPRRSRSHRTARRRRRKRRRLGAHQRRRRLSLPPLQGQSGQRVRRRRHEPDQRGWRRRC